MTRVNEERLDPQASIGSFPGTDWSTARGYVYFPSLESEREVDSWSRTELMRRGRAMYNGIGFVRGLINGISRMACGTGLAVQPTTSSAVWNRRAQASFAARTASRESFHLARKYSFASSQRAVVRGWLKDGDLLSVLARLDNGGLRVALYEGNQIGNGAGEATGWTDGVRLDGHRGALGYRILTRDEKGRKTVPHTGFESRQSRCSPRRSSR
ncbi:MAG TPA: phage portal protein, partial [Bacteroidia bacterium]|nr:phage portal protein [Bacteroidia bacterium]